MSSDDKGLGRAAHRIKDGQCTRCGLSAHHGDGLCPPGYWMTELEAKTWDDLPARERSAYESLRAEVQRLRAEVPPRKPVRLLGPGCVRFRDGELWLLNKRETGWGSFGLQLTGWDDLFRRFNAVVVGHGSDAFGEFWTVDAPKEVR